MTERVGEPALDVRSVSKTFGAQRALDDVELQVLPGQIHALVGQNGCGKSTFVKILSGFHEPDAGSDIRVGGRPLEWSGPTSGHRAGIRFVHQNLGLVELMTVADNFRLDAAGTALGRVNRREDRRLARKALDRLGYDVDPGSRIVDLRESERTAVAIARALADFDGVRLLVLDEPTASLPGPEADRLFAALRRIATSGTAILFISHHLDEVLGLADVVTVLRDGCKIATTGTEDLTQDQIVRMMLGRELTAALDGPEAAPDLDRARLVVDGLTGRNATEVKLTVSAGEVVGFAGLTGSGREEIAAMISGHTARDGSVVVDGVTVRDGRPREAIDRGLCYVPADRSAAAVLPGGTVRENLTISDLGPVSSAGTISRRRERGETRRWITALGIRPPTPEAQMTALSGGNQQKVVIGRWLRVSPAALVLDEPTQGVDVGAKATIHELVLRAASDGAAVLVCSSDAEELARLCTRVLVMRRGRVAASLTGAEITTDRIEHEQLTAVTAGTA